MIEHVNVGLVAVLIEAIGIKLAERRTALLLYFATIATIIILFMI